MDFSLNHPKVETPVAEQSAIVHDDGIFTVTIGPSLSNPAASSSDGPSNGASNVSYHHSTIIYVNLLQDLFYYFFVRVIEHFFFLSRND